MALSFKFKPIDAIKRVHEIAEKALAEIKGAPALKIVNHRIRPTLHISAPSKLARELGDWSSPEALDIAAKAALWCCEAYAKAMADERWLFDRRWGKKYRARQVVEGVFSILKRSCGLLACSVRCAAALRARVWASLAAYCLGKQAAQGLHIRYSPHEINHFYLPWL